MPVGAPAGPGRVGKLYLASSRISNAVVRSRTRSELLDEIARILVEAGGFAMAFVSWYDPGSHELRPVARFGDAGGYVDRIHVFGDDRPEGQGPAGTAFRSGACCLCQDFMEDPHTAPWRAAAAAAGWRASAAIPVSMGGSPCGVVSAYSREVGIFGPEEVALFEQLAADVSIGLERLETESKRRLAEAALATSERRLKLAVDAAAIGIYEWDLATGQVVWDERSQRLFGYEPGGFSGTYAGFADRVHPRDRAGVERVIATARETRTPFVHEFRIVWPDGSVHWISSRGEFTFDEAGRPLRLHGATFNIDVRKRAEASLRESEERLRQAVRVSGIGIFDHDIPGNTIYWSPEQRAIHGIALDSPVSLDLYYSRVHPSDRERIAEEARRAHDPAGDGLFDVEHRLLLPDGSVRWTSTRSQTFFEGKGDARRPVRTVGAVTDITERKRAAEDKAKLEASLVQAQKLESIGRLAGGVAHDFNNMLTVILGFAELAKAKAAQLPPEVLQGHLHEIVKAAERSRQITQQLLGFSRQQIIAPKSSDLNSIVEDLRGLLARLIGEDVELLFHPEPHLWKALLDASQINQILLNLAVNARDAMPNGGRLTIETSNVRVTGDYARTQANCIPGDYVMVAISDNGGGMSRDTQAHIFEPFFTTKEKGKGTGLGLATVYGIVQQNGGFVNVYSELGRGTTFRIYFPRMSGEGEAVEPSRAGAPAGAGKVLLVEDDDLVRGVTTAALAALGYTPLVAGGAEEALRICAASGAGIRLILTDVVMAGMTGTELRDRIQALHPEIKVLFMSGYTSNVIVTHGVLKKGVHFIQKPFSIEELGRKIAEMLGSTDNALPAAGS